MVESMNKVEVGCRVKFAGGSKRGMLFGRVTAVGDVAVHIHTDAGMSTSRHKDSVEVVPDDRKSVSEMACALKGKK